MRYTAFLFGICSLLGCNQHRTTENASAPSDSAMVNPDYTSTAQLTGDERKQRTNEFLKSLNVPTLEWLPLVEDFRDANFRADKAVAERCVILGGILLVVHSKAKRADMIEYFKKYELWTSLSPNEILFLLNENPTDRQRVDQSWKEEALYTLLWSLDKFDTLGLPVKVCDFTQVEDLPNLKEDPTGWIEKARLREKEEILNQLDLIYRIHWATRDAEINGNEIPGGFHPGIVFERHYALNWLVIYADEWDDISTDT